MQPEPFLIQREDFVLSAVELADLSEVAEMQADAALWRHFPQGRDSDGSKSAEFVNVMHRAWNANGIGYWTLRRAGTNEYMGYCGTVMLDGALLNLGFRLHRKFHRRGYVYESAQLALEWAHAIYPHVPVVAYLLEHNTASKKLVEKLGMNQIWRGPDQGNQDESAIRLVYALGGLSPTQREAIINRLN